MAEKRDMLDDLIDIQSDWNAVSNPLNSLADTLAQDPAKMPTYNPSDYKERPRAMSTSCLRIASKRADACTACTDVCPVDALSFTANSIQLAPNCRKCGLCVAACPTEALVSQKVMSRELYNKIARAASTYERCYVTCTRALGRIPQPNEVLLPCVGVVSSELWLSLLVDYDNISVYLPVGICDKCRTTTGEETYLNQITGGEGLSNYAVGLVVDEGEMTHEQSRAYKRSQFMGNMAQTGIRMATAGSAALSGAAAITQKIQDHNRQLNALQRSLEKEVGEKTAASRRRILTQRRKVMLSAYQKRPDLAKRAQLQVPHCDTTLCTSCGDCVTACTLHVCDLDAHGHFAAEAAYCMNCGACVRACPEGALSMRPCDPADLVVPDEEAERKKREAAKTKAQMQEMSEKGKKQLKKGLDALERLADD